MTTVDGLAVGVYRMPTADQPESDGTAVWSATTATVVVVRADGRQGLGWSYGHAGAAEVIEGLRDAVVGHDASPTAAWWRMLSEVRNVGRSGIAAQAISAVDIALWDLHARLLEVPLWRLWGAVRDDVPLYASGGFTSYDDGKLRERLGHWVSEGYTRAKIKIGREPDRVRELARVRLAREVLGPEIELFVDANGAYDRKQALWFAERFAELGVTYFEEPVTSDDLEGLRLLRDRAPASIHIAAGEYLYHPIEARRMLEAGAVDILQLDATRCLGFTGFLKAAALCDAWSLPLSAHTAPALHAQVVASLPRCQHVEAFDDHVRLERTLFAGLPRQAGGRLHLLAQSPGHGMTLRPEAERWRLGRPPK